MVHWNGWGTLHQRKPKLRDPGVIGNDCVGLQITGSGFSFEGKKTTIILNILRFWHFILFFLTCCSWPMQALPLSWSDYGRNKRGTSTLSQSQQHKVKGKQKKKVVLIISGVALVYYLRSITGKENHHTETDTDATDKRITKKKNIWKRRENLLFQK